MSTADFTNEVLTNEGFITETFIDSRGYKCSQTWRRRFNSAQVF